MAKNKKAAKPAPKKAAKPAPKKAAKPAAKKAAKPAPKKVAKPIAKKVAKSAPKKAAKPVDDTSYRSVHTLKNITIDVKVGQLLSICGPVGSGMYINDVATISFKTI